MELDKKNYIPENQQEKRWKWLNEDLQKYIKASDLYNLGSTYYEMANFIRKEGRDNALFLKLGYEAKLKFQNGKLKEYKKTKVCTSVEIISTGEDSCEICRKLDGKVFSIDDALVENPLPVKNCNHEYGCRCVYGSSISD